MVVSCVPTVTASGVSRAPRVAGMHSLVLVGSCLPGGAEAPGLPVAPPVSPGNAADPQRQESKGMESSGSD